VTDDERPEPGTQSKKNETVFFILVRIVPKDCAIVVEDGFRFLKGNAMFLLIGGVLLLIPLESQIGHRSIV
jgi:hypothetical protein